MLPLLRSLRGEIVTIDENEIQIGGNDEVLFSGSGGTSEEQQQQIQESNHEQMSFGGFSSRYYPYRFLITPETQGLTIYARSSCGSYRKNFNVKVAAWCYVEFPMVKDVPRVTRILKEELSTDGVVFDDGNTRQFIIEPSESLTTKVKDVALKITIAPLVSSAILSRFGKSFFDPIHESGRWVEEDGGGGVISSDVYQAIQTMVWCIMDDSTFSTVEFSNGCFQIRIWTTYSFFSDQSSRIVNSALTSFAALADNMSCKSFPPERRDESTRQGDEEGDDHAQIVWKNFQIFIVPFASQAEMIYQFTDHVKKNVDLLVHYGEVSVNSKRENDVITTIVRDIAAAESCEIFDLCDYVSKIFTDMDHHRLETITSEIDIYKIDDVRRKVLPFPIPGTSTSPCLCDPISLAASQSLWSAFASTPEVSPNLFFRYYLSASSSMHLNTNPENTSFLVEKIIARSYLTARLYSVLSQGIFELAQVSGTNVSELTDPEKAGRGFVAQYNQIAAWSPLNPDVVPRDYMEGGLFEATRVVPLSHFLIEAMKNNEFALTSLLGDKLEAFGAYGWMIRAIYGLSGLKNSPLRDIPSAYGFYRNMVYLDHKLSTGLPTSREWTMMINLGELSSWIGISVLPNQPKLLFGYFGLDDACRHPFEALRLAIEMFLALKIVSHSTPTPLAVAQSITLTKENTALYHKITRSNLSSYRSLLDEKTLKSIEDDNRETMLQVWYRSPELKFTTNPILMDRSVYVSIIESTLKTSFRQATMHHSSSAGVVVHRKQQQQQRQTTATTVAPPLTAPSIPSPPDAAMKKTIPFGEVAKRQMARETPMLLPKDNIFSK